MPIVVNFLQSLRCEKIVKIGQYLEKIVQRYNRLLFLGHPVHVHCHCPVHMHQHQMSTTLLVPCKKTDVARIRSVLRSSAFFVSHNS